MNASLPITEDDLHAYVDGALDPARRIEVEAYLDTDQDAATRVRKFMRQRSALRAACAPFAEAAVPPQLHLARLVRPRHRAGLSFWTNPASNQMAAAAVLLFLFGSISGWALRSATFPRETGFRPLAEEAAENYRVYESDAVHPVEIKADGSDELTDWVSSRLQRRVAVPKQVSGFHLLGGRVVSTSRGAAAMFMYDDGHGVRIVFMVCPNTIHTDAPMTEGLQRELGSVSWSEHRMGYSLVGAESAEKLQPLAEAMRRAIERNES